jgi:MGT family glycosyltransferase
VGPCYPDLPNPPEFPFSKLDGRKVIYATLGTVYGRNRSFFRRCIEAYRQLADCCVVLSTGNGLDPAELGEVPPHIIIRPFVPQWEILARADLFITHGGMNSIHAGLYHGVPMIVMPQGIATDQQGNARTIERLGAGVSFNRLFYSAATLRELSLRVMADPEIKARLAVLKVEFQQSQGPVRGAEEIIQFVQRRRSDSQAVPT